jgi:hypothetical protein
MYRRSRPIVFGSASLALVPREYLPLITVRPPIRRGDLRECDGAAGTVLILDGLFGSSLAITPTECRELLDRGWVVAGAASMGALRAADLWPAGMLGFGDIYNLFRTGVLRSDADVAVALDADGFSELTVSAVHVRALLEAACGRGLIASALARRMLQRARTIYWAQRWWPALLDAWSEMRVEPAVLETLTAWSADPSLHPKAIDGRLAVETLLARRWKRATAAAAAQA